MEQLAAADRLSPDRGRAARGQGQEKLEIGPFDADTARLASKPALEGKELKPTDEGIAIAAPPPCNRLPTQPFSSDPVANIQAQLLLRVIRNLLGASGHADDRTALRQIASRAIH